ncbi:MAG TPA: hypothetical protein VMC85_11805 [Desulfomonilaceae bacterium]|nr:hypothetical protein [Desulfomonilaceae bacterium]
MSRKFIVVVLVASFMLVLMLAVTSQAGGFFVATAKNFRGALYKGFGPTPGHACEDAIVKCSQDSFAPPSCKVIGVRMECPPPLCPPPRKAYKSRMSKVYPQGYPMGRPMP